MAAEENNIDGSDSWLADILDEIGESVEGRNGKVVIYNDDHSNAILVELILLLDVTEGDQMLAKHQMLKIHFEGRVTAFEGPLTDADKIVHALTRGGFDEEWLEALKVGVPAIRALLATRDMLQSLAGDDSADMAEFISNVGLPEGIREALQHADDIDGYLLTQQALGRPKLRATVIAEGMDVPDEWPGDTVLDYRS